MIQVLIIEENTALGVLLKREFAAERYQVSVAPAVDMTAIGDQLLAADIVLINHACGNGSGWDIYRQIKMKYQKMTVMLYVLESWSQNSVKWIMKAVREALNDTQQGKGISRGIQKRLREGRYEH